MRPPVAYYGGKNRLGSWIASMLPPHRVYLEPFCGSAAVLFAKRPSTHELLNDAEGDVINFLRVLRDQPEDLELACRLTPYARDEYATANLDAEDLDDLERARRWWVRSSQSFGQMAKVGTGWSTSIQRGSNNARSVWNRLDRFAAAAERLGPVTIENLDAFDFIDRYAVPDAAIYCDPPYLGAVRTSIGDYACEFHTDADHRALADVLTATPAAVLISGYPHPLYDELYAGWDRTDRPVMVRVGRGSRRRATEVIWSNRPLADGRLFRSHT